MNDLCKSKVTSGGSRISPSRGRQLPGGGGAPTYDFAKISQKLHEIERIWTPGDPLRSATGSLRIIKQSDHLKIDDEENLFLIIFCHFFPFSLLFYGSIPWLPVYQKLAMLAISVHCAHLNNKNAFQ